MSDYKKYVTSGIAKPECVSDALWQWAHYYLETKGDTYSGWNEWVNGGEGSPWQTMYAYWLLRDFGMGIPKRLHKRLANKIARMRVLGED